MFHPWMDDPSISSFQSQIRRYVSQMLVIHQHQCILDGGGKKRALKQGKTMLVVKDNLIMQQW